MVFMARFEIPDEVRLSAYDFDMNVEFNLNQSIFLSYYRVKVH